MYERLIRNNTNGLEFFLSGNIDKLENIKHFFSTRNGGSSKGIYRSLNLGIYTDDIKENVFSNFKEIFDALNMKSDKLVYLKQVHGDTIHVVNKNNYQDIIGKDGDALITRDSGIAIGVFTADCVPILLADRLKGIIAAVHAGWKGTYLGIVTKVLNYMIEKMEANPVDIFAAIGPSIGSCCFEVKEDVAEKFDNAIERENKLYVDLINENIKQIINIGIPEKNIEGGGLCTRCNEELFFSYRRDNGKTGRQGTFIQKD